MSRHRIATVPTLFGGPAWAPTPPPPPAPTLFDLAPEPGPTVPVPDPHEGPGWEGWEAPPLIATD